MYTALITIAIIYGICLFGTALINCPSPLALFVLVVIVVTGIAISDKISDAKRKKRMKGNKNES